MPEATTSPEIAPIDAPRSRSWRCSDCNVSVSFAAGPRSRPARRLGQEEQQVGLPALSARARHGPRRLRRGADGWASRREALMEFELLRTPEESDVVIAKRANCSTGHVRKARQGLKASGKLPKRAKRAA